ncbi:MAG: DUF2608 domain-containing protein [Alphaproteobacteria bacterium]|nr:DUF2608 domain-containing protein [Alphaproteobacteria bacterium]
MRKFLCLAALLLAIGCSSNGPVETLVTYDDKVLQQILEKADKDTLVIFDCDKVLIVPTDMLFSPANKSNYKKAIRYLNKKVGFSKADDILLDLRKRYKFRLVNDELPNIIRNMQAQGVTVLVLTSHWAGEFHGIKAVENLRKNELAPFDFDFKKSWNGVDKITFYELPAKLPKYNVTRYPVFENGIIFACDLDKGTVLQKFLERIPQKFSKIIFVDDKMKNVRSIGKFCETNNISGKCVQYKKAKLFQKNEAKFQDLERELDKIINSHGFRS